MIRSAHWYSQNAMRDYPLADNATAVGVDGVRLPTNVITDLALSYPGTLGACPFVASVAVTASLVSVTFQVASDLADTTSLVPLAAVSLPKPIVPGRHYALRPQADGVGGWIVFGEGAASTTAVTARFSVTGGLLCPRAAKRYAPLPVRDIGRLHSTVPLSGLVRLQAEAPVEIVGETRTVGGISRKVGVIRLKDDPTAATSVFAQYVGPCGKRPESGNCPDPQPIEFLNTVAPDCNGNITIEFRGCAMLAGLQGEQGAVLDCALGLIDVCTARAQQLPTSDGVLSNEYDDQCTSLYSATSESLSVISVASEVSMPADWLTDLPYSETFEDRTVQHWRRTSGYWGFAVDAYSDDPYSESGIVYTTAIAKGTSGRNIAVLRSPNRAVTPAGPFTVGRVYTADMRLRGCRGGAKHNAGIVLNYRLVPGAKNHVCYLVELVYESQELRISRFNGTTVIVVATAPLVNLQLDRWYRVTVTTEATAGDTVTIGGALLALDGPVMTQSVTYVATDYLPDTGDSGLHTDRSEAEFAYFTVANA